MQKKQGVEVSYSQKTKQLKQGFKMPSQLPHLVLCMNYHISQPNHLPI